MRTNVATLLLTLRLVQLHGPDDQIVLLNPEQVVALREPRGQGQHFHAGVKCLVFTTDSKYTPVKERCAAVKEMLQRIEQEE